MTKIYSFDDDTIGELAKRAEHVARRVGEYVASVRPKGIEEKKAGQSRASQVVTEVDREAERMIVEMLMSPSKRAFSTTNPVSEIGLLTEEREDDGSRHQKTAFWCIDPLDGTLPYVEGMDGYAVSIALVTNAGTPLLGAVSIPADDVVFRCVRGKGAWRNGRKIRQAESRSARQTPHVALLKVFADQSWAEQSNVGFLQHELEVIAKKLGLDDVDFQIGSGAVVNACRTLLEGPAVYIKLPKPEAGGGSLWDFAATACLAGELGGVASDIYGTALDLNRLSSTYMNHRGVLFASSVEVASAVKTRCQQWIKRTHEE